MSSHGRLTRSAARGSIHSTYQGCSVGVSSMPAPRTQNSARSGRNRLNVAQATTARTMAAAAYRGANGPGITDSMRLNGPSMKRQCSA